MNEFSTDFVFDLQRFANFTGGDVAGEEGVTLSELFNSAGKAWLLPTDKSKIGENSYFWEKSDSVVNLTPDSANADDEHGSELTLVAGKYDTVSNSDGDSATVIKSVSVIDAQNLSDTAIFSKTNGLNKIINPANEIKVGSTGAITFSGDGEKKATDDKTIDEKKEYEVGTIINVSNGEIKNVEAAKGEEITTADTTHTTFVNGGTATFANKSFNTIEAFASADGTAELAVDSDGDDEKAIVLEIDEFNTTAKEGKTAVTVSFDGQAIKSIDVAAKDTADIQFSGNKVFGNDIAINKGTVNVANLSSEDGSFANYHLNANGSDTLDLMGAGIKENKNVAVTKTGNAKFLIAKDDNSEDGTTGLTTIKIGDTEYKFNDADGEAGNGGVFLVSNNKATGFLFRDAGDGIVVSRGMKNFKLYKQLAGSGNAASNMLAAEGDADLGDFGDTQEIAISIESDSNEYTVEQAEDKGFEIEVKDDTTLKIGKAEIDFKLPSTSSQAKDARTSAKIKISADGKLESIKAGNKASGETSDTDASFDVGGIEISFKGMNDSDVISEEFAVGGVKFVTKTGDFNYSVAGKEGQVSNEVSLDLVNEEDEIILIDTAGAGASKDNVKVTPVKTKSEGEDTPSGEIIYKGMTYKYSSAEGNAYLKPVTEGEGETAVTNLKFVFVDEGDALTIPDGGADYLTPLYYNRLKDVEAEQELTILPVIDGEYTIVMTQDTDKKHGNAEFEITTAEANTTITFGEGDDAPTFTFSDANGKFFFGQKSDSDTVALGFTAASGTVTMNEKAATEYLGQTDVDGKAVFKVDGTVTNITAANIEGDELVYTKEDKSLAGLGDTSAIVEAGDIQKIYAPIDKGSFTFGDGDDAKTYAAEAGSEKNRAYFTVVDGKPVSFTFMTDDDEITSDDFSGLTLIDNEAGTSFEAPVVTNADGEGTTATILKTTESIDGKRTKCYTLNEVNLDDKNVEFGDGTKLFFEDANDDTDILFSTEGKLLIIEELDQAKNEVVVSNATGAIRIDDSEVEILGGGFTFTMLDEDTPTLTDFKAGSNIIKLLKGIDVVQTVGGEEGIGGFTLGSGNEFEVSGTSAGVDGVDFYINSPDGKEITVAGISDIDGDESVTGALNGLLLNGSTSVAIDGASGTKYTFSGTSFAGLVDGDKVTGASGITDFITGEAGAFEILGTSMAIAGDSKVVFGIDENGSLTSITELAGTATGNFTEEITVNNETVRVVGDSSIAVTGANDDVVTAIAGVSGASVALVQIGSASQVATDGDVGIEFVAAQQAFGVGAVSSTSDGVVFGIDETSGKVTSIDGLDQKYEYVRSNDFSDGISVNGGLVQVTNGGAGEPGLTNIMVVSGGESRGLDIVGLFDGATVQAAEGVSSAVAFSNGTFTFADGKSFNIAGDSRGVQFVLDGKGNVVGIDYLGEDATVTGALDGIWVNHEGDPIQIAEGNENLSYSNGTISGVTDTNTVQSADGATFVQTDGSGTFTFANGEIVVEGDADGVTFEVTDKNKVVGIAGLDVDATLSGAIADVTKINGASVVINGDSSFAVVGAESGISKILNLSGSAAEVVEAGGASVAIIDTPNGTFTFAGESFNIESQFGPSSIETDATGTEFSLNEEGKVTAIDKTQGFITSEHLNGLAINGNEKIDVEGDVAGLGVFVDKDGEVVLLGGVDGEDVKINSTGGAVDVITNVTDGKVTFTKSGQEFKVSGDVGAIFNLEDDRVYNIGMLSGTVEGDFSEGLYINARDKVNGNFVQVAGDSSIGVTGDDRGVVKIEGVGAGATVNAVGGASSVFTNEEGIFTFADNDNPFTVTGDNNVEFVMVAGESAKVAGISQFADAGNATVAGGLNDIAINGAGISVTGDDDDVFSYEVISGTKILGEVGGSDVNIDGAGGANYVDATVKGNYTFGDKLYELNDNDGAIFGMSGLDVTSIIGLSGDVTGDFSADGFRVNGYDMQIEGDDSVKVVAENNGAPSRIENFSDGASIIAAEGPSVALADTDGNFTDARYAHVGISGTDEAVFNLDGHGNFVSVENVEDATVSGDLDKVLIDGHFVSVVGADGELNRNVTLAGGVLSGVEAGDTIYGAGNATKIEVEEVRGIDSVYTFVIGTKFQQFTLEAGDHADSIGFVLDNAGNVAAIESLGGAQYDAQGNFVANRFSYIKSANNDLNNITINGQRVSVVGDANGTFGVAGWTNIDSITGELVDTGLEAIYDVTGNRDGSDDPVTIYEAGDAHNVITDGNGLFIFDKANQKFNVEDYDPISGKQSVTFQIDEREKVQGIYDLDGTVHGDFGDNSEPEDWGKPGIEVNGISYAGGKGYGDAVRVTGDRDGVSVVGSSERGVEAVLDVDAGATIVTAANATMVKADGEGIYTFDTFGQNFTIKGASAVEFMLDGDGIINSVTGVEGMENGKLSFNTEPTNTYYGDYYRRNLTVNDEVNDEMRFQSTKDVTLTIKDSVVTAVEGLVSGDSLNGYEAGVVQADNATVTYKDLDRRDIITTDDKEMYVQDYDNDFDVITDNFGVTRLERVTGDAIINHLQDGVVITDDEGEFLIGGKSYAFVDSDGVMTLTTDRNGNLDKVDGLQGTIELNDTTRNEVVSEVAELLNTTIEGFVDGYEKVSINGNFVEVFSDRNVSITSDGASITAVDGLVDGDMINGDLDNAAISMKAADGISDPSDLIVNGIHYMLLADDTNDDIAYGNTEGVIVNGNETVHGIDGLKDGQRMLVVNAGTYRVNGTVLEADVNDTIVGADGGAYLYDPDNILVRKSTPVRDIATLVGVPIEVDENGIIGSAADPIVKESLEAILEDPEFDRNRRLEIYTTNPDPEEKKSVQTLDFSGDKFTKKVHLYDGLQDLIFNSDGGNVAHIARYNPSNLDSEGNPQLTSGIKNITLGGGASVNPYGAGDLVIVDETKGIDNQVNILGGAGDDSIFVRDNVRTVFDMAKGGKDRIVTFAGAEAQIQLENYNATTGAGIQFDEWRLQTPKDPTGRNTVSGGNKIHDAILSSKHIRFGDGVVSLVSESGTSEVSLNSAQGGTESIGNNSIVNLFTPEGRKQVVGFTHSGGGLVNASAFTDDLILLGNYEGNKLGSGTLLGGDGNDSVYAGAHDFINAGAGENIVSLQADDMREGAEITIASGNTTLYNMNNTLDEIHGDTLAVDLTTLELEFDGETSQLIVKSRDKDEYNANNVYAVVVDADKDGELLYDTATDKTSNLASSADDADETDDTKDTDDTTPETVAVASPLVADHNYTNQIIRSGETMWKAAIGAKGSVIDVKLDEDVRANYYKGDNSGLTFGAYNGNVLIDLKGDWKTSAIDGVGVIIEGINSIQAGTGENIIKGSDENEVFFAGRGNTYLYGDGGKNLLVGYTGDDKEGQTNFFVLGHAADGVHTIQAFDFVDDDNYTNNSRITADKLVFDLPTNYVSRVDLSQNADLEYNDVVVEVTNKDGSGVTESVVIKDAKGKDILISGDGVIPYDVIAQIGDDQLTFDKFANYYAAIGKNATLTVTNDKDVANVWLDGSQGVDFQGDIKVINASEFVGLAELAGNDYDNTILAGNGQTSLWGGHHGDDVLVASESGKDTFYYTLGNGTDTIFGAKDGDIVDLAGVTLDQIASTEFSVATDPIQGVAINFKDGGKLYIGDDGKNNVQYKVGGETYYVNETHNGWIKKA